MALLPMAALSATMAEPTAAVEEPQAVEIAVPSGQPVELIEVLNDQVGAQTWLRFRFVAPQIGPVADGIAFEAAAEDMAHLCDTLALPYLAQHALSGDMVVISMAERAVEFGASDPETTQFFEAFRIQEGRCIWEGF